MADIPITLNLPEDLVTAARNAGLLTDERIAELLRSELTEQNRQIEAFHRRLYAQARTYWRQVGNMANASLTDSELDEQFWFIDNDGVPHLKHEQDTLTLPDSPLENLIGIVDDDVEDLSTNVNETMRQYSNKYL